MTHWDQDIHRIQEIQQLLHDRQRYFSGRLNTSSYKLDPNGHPLNFPKLSSTKKGHDSNEPSLGHSVEANFGSTDTCSNDLPINTLKEEKGDHSDTGAQSDSSDGNHADQSHNESSDVSGTGKTATKKKVVRKTAKTLRKWVTKNLKVASTPRRKSNASDIENANSRKSSNLRFKSVSFDRDPAEFQTAQNELDDNDLLYECAPRRVSTKIKAANPINLIRKRSWILKAEMVSRLNENSHGLNFNKVMTDVSKSSISHARDKLRKAERSLRATVKNEHLVSIYKKPFTPAIDFAVSKTSSKLKPTINKPAAVRIASRQQEEALRSDLNLREAFALIKIDPDPILELRSSVENDPKLTSSTRKLSLVTEKGTTTKHNKEHMSRKSFAIDDSRTTQSLKRLTKLSIQHLQRQQSLIPSSVPLFHAQKGKEMERKVGKSVKPEGDTTELTKAAYNSTRRKSSITSAPRNDQSNITKQSKNFGREHASNLTGMAAKATARVDRRASNSNGESLRHSYCTLDKLVGTVI